MFLYTQRLMGQELQLFIKYTCLFKYTTEHVFYTEMRKSFFSMIISDKDIKKKERKK